jgi:hypothetical protein
MPAARTQPLLHREVGLARKNRRPCQGRGRFRLRQDRRLEGTHLQAWHLPAQAQAQHLPAQAQNLPAQAQHLPAQAQRLPAQAQRLPARLVVRWAEHSAEETMAETEGGQAVLQVAAMAAHGMCTLRKESSIHGPLASQPPKGKRPRRAHAQ